MSIFLLVYIVSILSILYSCYKDIQKGSDCSLGTIALTIVLALLPVVNVIVATIFLSGNINWNRVIIKGKSKPK